MNSDIKVLMLQTSNAGVAHYRIHTWATSAHRNKAFFVRAPWFDKNLTETHPWEIDLEDTIIRRQLLGELDSYMKVADIVICQMVHTRAALTVLEGMKAMYKIPLVTEMDDNMLSTPAYNPASAVYGNGSHLRALAIEQMRMSDALIVSTPGLKETYSEFCENIYVLENSLDLRVWNNLRHPKRKDFVRLGWAGGASHVEDLRIIEPVVRKTLEKHKTARFMFIHGVPDFFRNIDRVETVADWTRIDRWPQFLASKGIDIGLAPLVDSAFNRSKSNLRWLEYSGLRIPTIASKVGHFAETIEQAVDGMLCESEDDWLQSIDWLISDEVARKKIAKNAGKKVYRSFNVEANIFRYRDALLEVRERGQVVKVAEVVDPVEASA